MEGLSALNMAIAAVVVGTAWATNPPAWAFWTALVAGGVIMMLEAFDEWAERHELASEVVGPESVVLLAGVWMAVTALVVGGSATFVVVATVGGLLVALASGMNLVSSLSLEAPEVGGSRP